MVQRDLGTPYFIYYGPGLYGGKQRNSVSSLITLEELGEILERSWEEKKF